MTPLVNLTDWEVAAVDFRIEGILMAPAQAIPRLLARQDLEGRTARALGDPRGLRLATACEARRRAAFPNGGAEPGGWECDQTTPSKLLLSFSEAARLTALSIQKGNEPRQSLKPLPSTAAQQISVPPPLN